ncbi:response regulator [Ectobacillus panaciterrae]|uniref:response regulator n=1 Tax=Ectobacillus panaciterrae TaxID=363872 RepID=UPI0003FA8405|nr:response regulator [Ectobacillus panaciterrae]
MIRVLIVEDDPMVAEFNKRYLEQVGGFQLVSVVTSVDAALHILEKKTIDLILLDIFMPGKTGLELLMHIRETGKKADVIFITAASDMERIQTALRYGAVDYLMKPFEFDRFNEALSAYREKFMFMKNQQVLSQKELDRQILHKEPRAIAEELPKGVTKGTLQVIWETAQSMGESPFSTEDIAGRVGISRVSVRKYLKFLSDIDALHVKVHYGTIGRPIYQYKYNKAKENIIKNFL